MIETALNISAGGDADHDVRKILPFRAPVFMRQLDEGFHRRPEIIGELRAFDDDPSILRIDAAKTIGSADNKILGDWRIEDALLSEFLLHPFRDIEDAAFFFIRHILTPNE